MNIALMGDSVLDNFYWLDNPKENLTKQLETLLAKTNKLSQVHNYAVDESEVKDIINGKEPAKQYVLGRKENGIAPYPVSQNNKVYPLELIIDSKAKLISHVVLSIGGNDVRVRLGLKDPAKILKSLLSSDFIDNFKKTLDKVTSLIPQTIVVICYRPHVELFSGSKEYLQAFEAMCSEIITPMLKAAYAKKLPVIDLFSTFDPFDRKDYGSTPIEPSNRSSLVIAHLIEHVVLNHDFGKESKIYYGKFPNIKKADLDQTAKFKLLN